jgi:REP element-mobilizing transposase RayT
MENMRPLRIHVPDGIYHAFDRGVEQRDIFLSDTDRETFLRYLKEALAGAAASLLSYCLMPNHFHLQIAVNTVPLSDLMHHLLTRYSLYFNRAYGRVGHLFQGRFGDELCHDLPYVVRAACYIHRNPVKAGLVLRVEDWPWSGHRELVSGNGGMLDLSRLRDIAGITPDEFRRLYLERLGAGLDADETRDPFEMLRRISALHGVSSEDVRAGRRGDRVRLVKAELADWARDRGVPDFRLAEALGCSPDSVRQMRRRYCHNRA